uniref:Glyoxysomal processing protease, glyoxysomal n=1 Tax=Nelumbo nucifera TaxID=4432 RepID=A0A822XKW5_NELNU|nr:TPA_asm: hypothetical protein HUJ06_022463 [Nelumbo nucifera]
MELPEIVQFARNFAVMVRIQGPDPKGLKMRGHAFHQYQSGITTLSASGMLLPNSFSEFSIFKHALGGIYRKSSSGLALVVTVASIMEPFLSLQYRESAAQAPPELIPGAQIDVMVETKVGENLGETDKGTPLWLRSELLALIGVPASSLALQSLIEAPTGSPENNSWEVGWSLAFSNGDSEAIVDALQKQVKHDIGSSFEALGLRELRNPTRMATSATRIAFLGVHSITSEDLPNMVISPPSKRGDLLLAMGSPFGILSPVHFLNSISAGSVANCYPPNTYNSSLLMADIRCLPGMEGAPVFGEHANLIGILTRPLRQRAGSAEIQLVIPWEAVVTAMSDSLPNQPQKMKGIIHYKEDGDVVGKGCSTNSCDTSGFFNPIYEHRYSHCSPPVPVEKAMPSIALITIDDGAWASGVLLNNHGLILTNAHLLEPWRFAKRSVRGHKDGNPSAALLMSSNRSMATWHENCDGLETVKISDASVGDKYSEYKLSSIYKRYRRIRARLDHMDTWMWCDARVVYVSKGPLDIALLQLESVPTQLCPMVPDFTCPSPGSEAHVIGHGLFGPRCVARVVKAEIPLHSCESNLPNSIATMHHNAPKEVPVMLETTASVHPGGSGGAVVNSDGHMIGLVTSNARHSGGTVIPHLNFSIPCAALEPIFKFSKDMQDLSILENLDKPNENLSAVWALMPPLSPKVRPQFPHLPEFQPPENKGGKGSRFAKFLAEQRTEAFPRPNKLVRVEKVSNKLLPSKL